mmetsp:Transcript_30792/g.92342  ORF Transcript_30792/g.92342 Transcript_30792/m.92342 type:complete len:286 (-) Transcript_30792:601-1458(-)
MTDSKCAAQKPEQHHPCLLKRHRHHRRTTSISCGLGAKRRHNGGSIIEQIHLGLLRGFLPLHLWCRRCWRRAVENVFGCGLCGGGRGLFLQLFLERGDIDLRGGRDRELVRPRGLPALLLLPGLVLLRRNIDLLALFGPLHFDPGLLVVAGLALLDGALFLPQEVLARLELQIDLGRGWGRGEKWLVLLGFNFGLLLLNVFPLELWQEAVPRLGREFLVLCQFALDHHGLDVVNRMHVVHAIHHHFAHLLETSVLSDGRHGATLHKDVAVGEQLDCLECGAIRPN